MRRDKGGAVFDIFVNYRRSDSEFPAAALFNHFEARFPKQVFIDIDRMPRAVDFASHLRSVLETCSIMITLIGPHWVDERLNDPEDFVRIEIEHALDAPHVRIVPVLLGNATSMPAPRQLPASLQRLCTLQAETLHVRSFDAQVTEVLIPLVSQLLDEIKLRRQQAENAKHSDLIPGDSFRDEPQLPAMTVIPQGRFQMGVKGGRSNEGPLHTVAIRRRIAMGQYPVTVRQWNFAVQNGLTGHPALALPLRTGKANTADFFAAFLNSTAPSGLDDEVADLYPAFGIGWRAAKDYCDWITTRTGRAYRLPTEAEWEYCCRAESEQAFATGGEITFDQAHFNRAYKHRHQARMTNRKQWPEVGPRSLHTCFENRFGLVGMHGNVWEWVEDRYHDNYNGAPSEGEAWTTGIAEDRVARGGCFASGPNALRSAARAHSPPTPRKKERFGFRIACAL